LAISLPQPLKNLLAKLQHGPIQNFLRWWWDELMGALPARWRDRLNKPPPVIVIGAQRQDQQLVYRAVRLRGAAMEGSSTLDLTDPAQLRRGLNRLESLHDEQAEKRVLALTQDVILRKRIQLPMAAEENLRQVLSFEMDRQTPFKASDVEFDWHIVKRDTAARMLVIDLAVVPKLQLEQALKPLREAGLQFDAIDLSLARDSVVFERLSGFNLLPNVGSQSASSLFTPKRMRFALMLAVLTLTGTIMQQSLRAREAALQRLQDETQDRQVQAMRAAALEKTVREAINGANFLADRKLKQPEAVKVLLELTQIVPENTWLERISFVGKAVQIQGQSARADQMISILQAAKYLKNPQFQGVIQPDPSTQLERFTLQADLNDETQDPASGTPAQVPSESAAPAEKLVSMQAGAR
jgi:general secretion pathway protein L